MRVESCNSQTSRKINSRDVSDNVKKIRSNRTVSFIIRHFLVCFFDMICNSVAFSSAFCSFLYKRNNVEKMALDT